MITLKKITKIYTTGKIKLEALKDINLEIDQGEFVAIMGPSGSGKSTLLNILGCMDNPTSGNYYLYEQDVAGLSETDLSGIRNKTFGFVFQSFNLLNYLNAGQNIELPLVYSDHPYSQQKVLTSLEKVNLTERAMHKPQELSGGQQQRVAIARALVNNPGIILADEPTGNLDSKSGQDIMQILTSLNNEGITVILVTHDDHVASSAHRIIHIRDGKVFSDTRTRKKKHHEKPVKLHAGQGKSFFSIKKIKQNLMIALKSIIMKKMRTFLTTLGILIGVASVISMISIGEGAKADITSNIKKMGANLLFIHAGARHRGMSSALTAERNRLTMKDAEMITEEEKNLITALTPMVNTSGTVVYQNRSIKPNIQGVNTHFPEINNFKIKYGSFFDDKAINLKDRVAVVGNTVVSNLFDGKNPVGSYIKINRLNFLIIGTFEPKGASFMRDEDEMIAIPVTTAQKRLLGIDYISSINIKVKDENLMDAAEERIKALLKRAHGLKENDEADFEIRSQMELLQNVQQTTKTFTLLLGGIASISLLVGGIGIMNIMLVTVMERIKEIGLRKAIGARKSDILYQFLTESIIICFLGGLIGILLGMTVSKLIAQFTQWKTSVSYFSILLSFLFSFLIGLFFGIYPAYKASSLRPIEALRYE
ncbi:MAG: ABC transporter permease [bacterium]|nr:ABC transporter permease [bacterium]